MAKELPPVGDRNTTRMEVIYENTSIPQFKGKKVFVLSGAFYGSVVAMMAEAGFTRAVDIQEADLAVFIGGVDVNPALYDQRKLPETQTPNIDRDNYETSIYKKCLELKIPMFGICRGAQLLHVLNGGKLWQHVQGHTGEDHWIYDQDEDVFVLANSMHHQMILVEDKSDLEVLAVCKDQISRSFKNADLHIALAENNKEGSPLTEIEVEAGYYHKTKSFFVQGHPEVSNPQYRSWCLQKLKDFMEEWQAAPDVQERIDGWRKAMLA